nr:LOW QUALITY PROTEIN: WD repeat-containing protein 44-like [Lepeophtheirus salmonis]
MSSGSEEEDEEFFDAYDVTPTLSDDSQRSNPLPSSDRKDSSLFIKPHPVPLMKPLITVSDDIFGVSLPEEITRELEEISKADEQRLRRVQRLEILRRKDNTNEDDIPNEEDEDKDTHVRDSTESSVEGIYLSGVRASHPFKVIEPDTRSITSSDNRSIHGRNERRDRISIGSEERRSSQCLDDFPKQGHPPQLTQHYRIRTVPDVVKDSTAGSTTTESLSGASISTAIIDKTEGIIVDSPVSAYRPLRRKKTECSTGAGGEDFPACTIISSSTINNKTNNHNVGTSSSSSFIRRCHHLHQQIPIRHHHLLHHPCSTISPIASPVCLPSDSLPCPPSVSLVTSTPAVVVEDFCSNSSSSANNNDEDMEFQTKSKKSLAREFETNSFALDLHSATQGQYVVKPQDDEKTRGDGASDKQSNKDSNGSKEEDPNIHMKGFNKGSSGGRRSSSVSGNPPIINIVGQHSLGSNGAKRKNFITTGSMDSGVPSIRDISSSSTQNQLNQLLRITTDSGKRLSDTDILKQVKVKNLDTGEEMDLVEAEEQLPQSLNPLSLHIMRLTSEYSCGDQGLHDSDTESMISSVGSFEIGRKKKKSSVRKLFGSAVKITTDVAKTISVEAKRATVLKPKESKKGLIPIDVNDPPLKRMQGHKTGPTDFEHIQLAQEIPAQHIGPIWCMRFSLCGQLLATAGQDKVLKIWALKNSLSYFKDMRTRYSKEKTSPTNSYDSVLADVTAIKAPPSDQRVIFHEQPLCTYQGHTSDLLDVSWSKNYFILTSSMDKTVRLWHISGTQCLCIFQHIDFVTALAFHPRNDQYFLSGSLDGKLRLWNIPDKKVTLWNEVPGNGRLITAANFIQNGKFAVVGTYDGRCVFYITDQLKYHTMINVRSARGKNSRGRKVTGIEPMPGEDKILVTSNDSRIRLYDLRDLSLSCKYKGYTNNSSQIRASFSHDGKYITCGSENQCLYLWKTHYDPSNLTARKDRNSFFEAIKAHNSVVTCSVFASKPERITKEIDTDRKQGYVLVTGDYDGDIKIFLNLSTLSSTSSSTTTLTTSSAPK